ncbi:hypothetical protein HYV73_02710 [Candidatus Uhrbacteria bacterium]|nr:hypothetical protein [Candidatus Uhrbacteria bacterium]
MILKPAYLLPLGLFLVGFGCSSPTEEIQENAIERQIEANTGTNANVDIQDDTVTFRDENTNMVIGNNAALPDGWPTDLVVPENGRIVVAAVTRENGGGATLSAESPLTPGELAAWYAAQMKTKGYAQESSANFGGSVSASYKKGESTIGFLFSASSGGDANFRSLVTAGYSVE